MEKIKSIFNELDRANTPNKKRSRSEEMSDRYTEDLRKELNMYQWAVTKFVVQRFFDPEFMSVNAEEREERMSQICDKIVESYPFLSHIFPELTFHNKQLILLSAAKWVQEISHPITKELGAWRILPKNRCWLFDECDAVYKAAVESLYSSLPERLVDLNKYIRLIDSNIGKLMMITEGRSYHYVRKTFQKLTAKIKNIITEDNKQLPFGERLSFLNFDGSTSYPAIKFLTASENVYTGVRTIIKNDERIDYLMPDQKAYANKDGKESLEKAEEADGTILEEENISEEISKNKLEPLTPGRYYYYLLKILRKIGLRMLYTAVEWEKLNLKEQEKYKKEERAYYQRKSSDALFIELCAYLDLTREQAKALLSLARKDFFPIAPMRMKIADKESIYARGFRLTSINTNHPGDCIISTNARSILPEGIMIEVATASWSIVCASATASKMDLSGNFNWKFLKGELSRYKIQVKKLKKEELKKIQAYCWNKEPDTIVDALSYPLVEKEHLDATIKQLVPSIADEILNAYNADINSNKNTLQRLIDLLKFCKEFAAQEDQMGAFAFTQFFWSTHISKGLKTDQDEAGAQLTRWMLEAAGGRSIEICFGEGDEQYKIAVNKAEENAKRGIKTLVLTSYKTAGAGLSPGFPSESIGIPVMLSPNAKEKGIMPKMTNWGMFFLGEGTGYFPTDMSGDENAFHGIRILTNLFKEKELSLPQYRKSLRAILESIDMGKEMMPEWLQHRRMVIAGWVNSTMQARESYRSLQKQALGRGTRHEASPSTTVVRAAHKAALQMCCAEPSLADTRLFTKTIQMLMDQIGKEVAVSRMKALNNIQSNESEDSIRNCSKKLNAKLEKLMMACSPAKGEAPTEDELEARRIWNKLQTFAASHQDLPKEDYEVLPDELKELYVDYSSVRNFKSHHPLKSWRMAGYFKIPIIRAYAEEKGWQTKPTPGASYYLLPSARQQLLSGAIGELVVPAVIRHEVGEPTPLSDAQWELNDMAWGKVGVDAKNKRFWASADQEIPEEYLRKAKLWGGPLIIVNTCWEKGKPVLPVIETTIEGMRFFFVDGLADPVESELNHSIIKQLIEIIKKEQ